ncbi:MAG: hypothetical protein H0U18_07285 [Pyrinomonadaceae bacterium]|nr:hypothetical protein [Pyrinomonadaceae bacterium]
MRIICDHCSRPISGTIKSEPGNFNLHPDCLTQLGKQAKHESTAVSWRSQKSSVSALLDWQGTVTGVPGEMK